MFYAQILIFDQQSNLYNAVTHELARISDFCSYSNSQLTVAWNIFWSACLREYEQKQERAESCSTKIIIYTLIHSYFFGRHTSVSIRAA